MILLLLESNLLVMVATKQKIKLNELNSNSFSNTDKDHKTQELYLLSINHNTAPVAIREKFSIQEYVLNDALKVLKKYSSFEAVTVLSTCNRTEIYFCTKNLDGSLKNIYQFFHSFLGLDTKLVKEYSKLMCADDVIEHIFNLAAGLNSLVLGEKQILSQLKTAYTASQKEKTLNNLLEKLLQHSIKTAKEVHSKTDLSKECQSVSSVAVELANKICGPIKTKSVMVLGAGQMAKLALSHIIKIGGSKETYVLNRSPHRVIGFSEKYKVDKSFPFENVYEVLNEVDVLISAAGAPHFILFAKQFEELRKDASKPLYIFDISMPRNIDSEFGRLPNVKLIDIDIIQSIYNQITLPKSEMLNKAKSIILNGISEFKENIELQTMDEIIKKLKKNAHEEKEKKLSLLKGSKITFTSEEVDYIATNIVNSILHKPIKNLKELKTFDLSKKDILKELFDL